jgi:cellulose synthase/poly-beta-1,6-N-acetylglucosamine synthase-like glycosyltransferase
MRRIYLTLFLIFLNISLMPFFIGGMHTFLAYAFALIFAIYFSAQAFISMDSKLLGGAALFSLLIIVPISLALVASLESLSTFETILYGIIAFGFTLISWHYLLLVPLAAYYKRMEEIEARKPLLYRPLVSVIIPARNEEKVIGSTIRSVLESDYEPKEVVVVDDGSTDRTFEIASIYQGPKVKVLRRELGGRGKARALNFGLRFARGEVIVLMDADTIISRDAIKELVRKLQDPRVSAVAGNVMVRNKVNLLTKLQAIEYIATFHLFRKGLSVLGAVPIISGALGAFRRNVLESSGLYDIDTLTEDFDVTLKALKSGKIVQASSYALAFTEAPEKLKSLYRQRLRWYRGAYEVLIKHRDAFSLSGLTMLDFSLILMNNLIIPLIDFLSIISIIIAILRGLIWPLIIQIILFSILQILINLFTLQLAGERDISLIFLPLFAIGYKQFHEILMLKCFFDVIIARMRGKSFSWTFIERRGLEEPKLRAGPQF